MRIEFIGGPKDGELMEVMDLLLEIYVAKSPTYMHNFIAFEKEFADTYPILIKGVYRLGKLDDNLTVDMCTDYYWGGWDDETTE